MPTPVAAARPSRPDMAVRIGVTGARRIEPAALPRVAAGVAAALAHVKAQLARLAATPRAAAVYQAGAPRMRIVSPLAEGSDRLVAEAGLGLGASLLAPLPFAAAEYENDFPATVAAFRSLAAQAAVVELDGARGLAEEAESYAAAGHFTVRNSDLVIAIWDGLPERGRGGTAEIVRFALREGVPVWWIDAAGLAPARFIATAAHLHAPALAPAGETALAALARHLEQTLLPPDLPAAEREGVMGRAVHHARRIGAREDSPLADYLAERAPSPNPCWAAHARLMQSLAPRAAGQGPQLAAPAAAPELYWQAQYTAADRCSIAYGDRYRSSYVLIALLAVAALVLGAAGEVPGIAGRVLLGLEVAVIAAIGLLVVLNLVYRWHERWISYRLLAELCRKQIALSTLGRSLPVADVAGLAPDGEAELPREAWVAWYFAACLRAAPVPAGSFAALKPRARDMARSLVAEQIHYHTERRARNKRAGHRIAAWGEAFFLATFILALLKVAAVWDDAAMMIHWDRLAGILVSAVSAAFVGIRAYSEFSLLAQQSAHMLRILANAGAELDAIPLDAPLASRDLGHALSALATAMMQDIGGWAQLFRAKTLEAA